MKNFFKISKKDWGIYLFFGFISFIIFSNVAWAASSSTTFENLVGFDSVSGLLSSVLSYLLGIVGTIALVLIVLGGVMYMTAGGDEKAVTRAKACWTAAVIGMAIVLAAPTFLKELQKILGGGSGGGSAESWVSESLTLQEIALNVLDLLLSLVGIIAVIALVFGGLMYLTSAGDQKRIDKAKQVVTTSIIGVIVALSAMIIIRELATIIVGS